MTMFFEGLQLITNEEILDFCQGMSNEVVKLMENGEKRESMRISDFIESKIVELKEWISQNNDIRSPYYDSNRQFIRQLNEVIVECHERMYEAYLKNKKNI